MRRIVVAAGAVLVAVALTGCSGGTGGNSGVKAADSAGSGASAAASASGDKVAAGAAGAAGNAGGSIVAGTPRGVTATGGHATVPVLDDGSAKIRTAQITVAVKDFQRVAQSANEADDIATRAGGEIDSDDRTSGRHATASLRLRVPPDQLAPVLTALGRLGAEQSRSSSTTDVTEQVADVTSRLASARESIARLRELYATATKVADVIAVESELSTREADLESLEAQQRSLSKQTAMASVALFLQTAATRVVAPKPPDRGGFLGGLRRGWDGFVAFAGWIATAVGTLAPFLALLLVLALAARLLGLRLPMRIRSRAAPAPSPSE